MPPTGRLNHADVPNPSGSVIQLNHARNAEIHPDPVLGVVGLVGILLAYLLCVIHRRPMPDLTRPAIDAPAPAELVSLEDPGQVGEVD